MLKSIELSGFKSFAKKTEMNFPARISAIVGPNGGGKSNSVEAFRFALGEQSMKSLRGSRSDDLLWNGSSQVPRANRAGVKLLFNNEGKRLDVDFDEVAVERIMHRDSSHQYYLNGSQVRLKDILETLASANIGPTGHHIISQGEADRILSVKPAERKRIIEDALGLKIYHYKKSESEKKLEKTQDNLQQILALQHEIEPELRTLSRQMSRIEKAQKIREESREKTRQYFASTALYIEKEDRELASREEEIRTQKKTYEAELASLDVAPEEGVKETLKGLKKERSEIEKEQQRIVQERRELERSIGRLEGRRDALAGTHTENDDGVISFTRLRELKEDILTVLREENAASHIEALFEACFKRKEQPDTHAQEKSIENEIEKMREKETNLIHKEQDHRDKLASVEKEIEELAEQSQKAGSEILEKKDNIRACESELDAIVKDRQNLQEKEKEMKEDVADLSLVFGREIASYDALGKEEGFDPVPKDDLRELRRDIERGRIHVEDVDLGEARTIEWEYNTARERNDFLQKEIDDLNSTRTSLTELIRDLEGELNKKFHEGIEHINDQFNRFFTMLFGGGGARLEIVREEKSDESVEEGVEIQVELPRKRIQGLAMLSGGERALTSIALVFSISYINPPPFLILDETDAALDEANSRKYGDMIEDLSEQSQLILVTHNRETMSRAGLLYGVTMGADGVSRLLSVKFEDAKMMAAR